MNADSEVEGKAMARTDSSIPAVLQERAEQRPDALAFTYIDYEQDPSGFAESLTWSQLFRRACAVAEELALIASPGDRVAIVAPQGMEYVVAFLGVLQAGLIAVPLSTPHYGVHDDRISSVLLDCNPVAVLTTSAVVGEVTKYATGHEGWPAPFVIEVNLLDLDSPPKFPLVARSHSGPAYLQYTSGSTRTPAGVVVTHRNVMANLEQLISDTFEDLENAAPPDTTVVTWLPFYHDLGLMCGIALPIVAGVRVVFMSPMTFLQKPARWMQLAARNSRTYTGGPNFAYELAVRRTTNEDMAGLDLGHVHTFALGAERVHAATIKRFIERFARFNLRDTALRPGYGLAEATVYATSNAPGRAPTITRFDYEKLSAGYAAPCSDDVGVDLVSCGVPRAATVRIVDPETRSESPAGKVGEIWIHGDNVADGYWRNPHASKRTFGGKLVHPSPGTPPGPWLRTGDLGFFSDGELFIMGRIKDLLIVDGRNHCPDDIEATIQEITGGRCAAIAVPTDISELLVAIIELKRRETSTEEAALKLRSVKRDVASAISKSHGLRVADLVLVAPGSIPITTSGKIRRSTCVERYCSDGFERLDLNV